MRPTLTTSEDTSSDRPTLCHFSEEPGIEVFEPRLLPSRPELTTPLVWAIDAAHQHMYLFPRDCPRVLLWPVAGTSDADHERWFGRSSARVIAYAEYESLDRITATRLYRYEVPSETFTDLQDAGMWVSEQIVVPRRVEVIGDLLEALRTAGVELRLMDDLTPLYGLWEETTLHWSSIRMHNARGWDAPTEDSRRNPRSR